jgi:hypothetical protein
MGGPGCSCGAGMVRASRSVAVATLMRSSPTRFKEFEMPRRAAARRRRTDRVLGFGGRPGSSGRNEGEPLHLRERRRRGGWLGSRWGLRRGLGDRLGGAKTANGPSRSSRTRKQR